MKDKNSKIESLLQEKLQGKILIDEPMKEYTTMRVGGPARFFFKAKNSHQLAKAISLALKLKIPYFVLGKGGNLIFSDRGFEGLVILNESQFFSFDLQKAMVLADSGISNSQLVMKAASEGLGGIEFLATIPGTLGGAVYGNAGAYGWEIASFIKNITLLRLDSQNDSQKQKIIIEKKSGSFLQPAYRSTRLKRRQTDLIKKADGRSLGSFHPIILTVALQLQRKDPSQITREIQKFIGLRRRRQPQGIVCSGSVFKNPLGRSSKESEVYQDIKKTAAYLLDQIGAKKIKVGAARVSRRHANFITHNGRASAQDIKDLMDILQKKVEAAFGIKLEPEIEFAGEFDKIG